MARSIPRARVVPDGLFYQSDFLTVDEQRGLLEQVERIDFRAFVMRGQAARRTVRSFGWAYGFDTRKLELSVGKHRVEFTDKTASKKYRYEINILAPDPDNKVIIVLGKADVAPRVTGKLQVRALP